MCFRGCYALVEAGGIVVGIERREEGVDRINNTSPLSVN